MLVANKRQKSRQHDETYLISDKPDFWHGQSPASKIVNKRLTVEECLSSSIHFQLVTFPLSFENLICLQESMPTSWSKTMYRGGCSNFNHFYFGHEFLCRIEHYFKLWNWKISDIVTLEIHNYPLFSETLITFCNIWGKPLWNAYLCNITLRKCKLRNTILSFKRPRNLFWYILQLIVNTSAEIRKKHRASSQHFLKFYEKLWQIQN